MYWIRFVDNVKFIYTTTPQLSMLLNYPFTEPGSDGIMVTLIQAENKPNSVSQTLRVNINQQPFKEIRSVEIIFQSETCRGSNNENSNIKPPERENLTRYFFLYIS